MKLFSKLNKFTNCARLEGMVPSPSFVDKDELEGLTHDFIIVSINIHLTFKVLKVLQWILFTIIETHTGHLEYFQKWNGYEF